MVLLLSHIALFRTLNRLIRLHFVDDLPASPHIVAPFYAINEKQEDRSISLELTLRAFRTNSQYVNFLGECFLINMT